MTKPAKQPKVRPIEPTSKENKDSHPFLLILEEQKEIMKAVRAGKPASSVRALRHKMKHD